MDLVAFVSTSENIFVLKMNGQKVWSIMAKRDRTGNEPRVECLRWRPDGTELDEMELKQLFDDA